MKIARVEVWKQSFKLRTSYEVAYGAFDRADNVFIRLHATDGSHGLGCAAPDPHVTGETADAVESVLRLEAQPRLQGRDPFRIVLRMNQLAKPLARYPSARAAVDMALYDLLGVKAGLPVYKLLGGYRDRIKTSITVGILPKRRRFTRPSPTASKGFARSS